MPTPHPYTKSDGTKSFRVRFRAYGRNTSETFSTKPDALAFCRDVGQLGAEAAVKQREEQLAGESLTVDEIAERFFIWKAGRVRSDRTVADYRRDYARAIKPILGYRFAVTITETDVQRWVELLAAVPIKDAKKPLSAKTISDRHALLHGIFSWAMSPSGDRVVPHNPCVTTDLPRRRKSPPKGLRPAEWQALEPALRQIDTDGADLALFLLSTGWRWSEAAAIDVFDVEDDGVRVHVNMGQVVRRNADGQHVIVDDGKSDAAIRRVELDAEAGAMVRRRIGAKTSGLVFTTKTGSQWHYSNFLNRIWKPAVTAANLTRQPTPHWLRHTHVFWMAPHTSLPELQRRIGHESIKTTIDVYGKMFDDVSPEALSAFAAVRAGAKPQQIRR